MKKVFKVFWNEPIDIVTEVSLSSIGVSSDTRDIIGRVEFATCDTELGAMLCIERNLKLNDRPECGFEIVPVWVRDNSISNA